MWGKQQTLSHPCGRSPPLLEKILPGGFEMEFSDTIELFPHSIPTVNKSVIPDHFPRVTRNNDRGETSELLREYYPEDPVPNTPCRTGARKLFPIFRMFPANKDLLVPAILLAIPRIPVWADGWISTPRRCRFADLMESLYETCGNPHS